MSACRSCGAAVTWCVTEAGKSMPVDAAPTPGGNLVIRRSGPALVAVVVSPLLESNEERAEPHYTSHFATCPNADAHRRGRK